MSVKKRLGQIGVRVGEDLAQSVYGLSQKYVKVRSGRLKRSGKVRKTRDGYEVAYSAPYAATVNYGRRGGEERVKAHDVKRHRARIHGRTVMVKRHHVRAFNRRVEGRDGDHFLDRAFDQVMQHEVKAQLLRASQEEARKAGS